MIKVLVAVVLLLPLGAIAQRQKRDPLSDLEVDKLRDAAQTPDVRLKLYIEFARTRLEHLQQAKADTKAADRDQQMHDALQDFTDIYDELDDNVDTFADRGDDLRKALKPVIEADTEFGSKLRAFKSSLASSREEFARYDYLVGTALQAVDDGARDHRSLLAEQEEKFKNKKEKPHKERKGGE
jgi:predicted  nucleic acid-binding Zn-ribbon protein